MIEKMQKINFKSFLFYFCLAIVITGLADFLTFWLGKMYIFEVNPIYILTKSVLLMFVLKILCLAGLCYLLLSVPKHQITQFLWVTVGFYLIILQILGAYSNLHTTITNPPPETAYEPQEAVAVYVKTEIFYFYIPLVLNLIIFQIWRWCYGRTNSDRTKYPY